MSIQLRVFSHRWIARRLAASRVYRLPSQALANRIIQERWRSSKITSPPPLLPISDQRVTSQVLSFASTTAARTFPFPRARRKVARWQMPSPRKVRLQMPTASASAGVIARNRRRQDGRRKRMILCAKLSRPTPARRRIGRTSPKLTSPGHAMPAVAETGGSSTLIPRSARTPSVPQRMASFARRWPRASRSQILPSYYRGA
mmetsp:Transcript_1404/g.4071  ORF Transcript_1404/g.4071 Transcript_1404/m.4071 type:complete len:202 (-) Transcript_1404:636-1241(-)